MSTRTHLAGSCMGDSECYEHGEDGGGAHREAGAEGRTGGQGTHSEAVDLNCVREVMTSGPLGGWRI